MLKIKKDKTHTIVLHVLNFFVPFYKQRVQNVYLTTNVLVYFILVCFALVLLFFPTKQICHVGVNADVQE